MPNGSTAATTKYGSDCAQGTGTGDVLEPDDGLIGIGSGGNYALAAARADAALGVARISYGHGPWAAAMDWLKAQAEAVYRQA